MKEVEFIPAICSGEKDGPAPMFQGYLKIRVPMTPERYEYMDLVGPEGMAALMASPYKAKDSSEEELEKEKSSRAMDAFKKMKIISKLFVPLKKHVISVELKKSDGSEHKSFDDLQCDPDCDPIFIEGAMLLLNGFKPAKN